MVVTIIDTVMFDKEFAVRVDSQTAKSFYF